MSECEFIIFLLMSFQEPVLSAVKLDSDMVPTTGKFVVSTGETANAVVVSVLDEGFLLTGLISSSLAG